MKTFAAPPWVEPRTAYIHVPFCQHHCGYCDFAVAAGRDHLTELYLDALELELATLGEPRPVETLFIGGGTPTYLSASRLDRLLATLARWLPLTAPSRDEFSIESTPESLTAEKLVVLTKWGVNRVSIGVQSFRPHLLKALDRVHTVEHIDTAVALVVAHGASVSLDLIFAAPGQSLAEWDADLSAALRLAPDHISTYGLTYEKGTPLWKSRERGHVQATPEETELAMYEHGIARLTADGFEHYEVSNFARPGHHSVHNQRYWANEAYFGFGVGAARYVQGRRELNVRDTELYIRRLLNGDSPTFQSECLAPRDRAMETVATQLRRLDGIARTRFQEQTGFVLDELLGTGLTHLVTEGLLHDEGERVRLTRRGLCVADGVIAQLMTAG